MKCELFENDGRFSLNLKPENVAEAALLVRLGMNATKQAPDISTSIYKDLEISTWIELYQRREPSSRVGK